MFVAVDQRSVIRIKAMMGHLFRPRLGLIEVAAQIGTSEPVRLNGCAIT